MVVGRRIMNRFDLHVVMLLKEVTSQVVCQLADRAVTAKMNDCVVPLSMSLVQPLLQLV